MPREDVAPIAWIELLPLQPTSCRRTGPRAVFRPVRRSLARPRRRRTQAGSRSCPWWIGAHSWSRVLTRTSARTPDHSTKWRHSSKIIHPLGPDLFCTSRPDPFVHCLPAELQAPNPVHRHLSFGNPPVDDVAFDAEVGSNLVHGEPSVFRHGFDHPCLLHNRTVPTGARLAAPH